MIVFNKTLFQGEKPCISQVASKERRRERYSKKTITKKNKIFLRSLGFKIPLKNASNNRFAAS